MMRRPTGRALPVDATLLPDVGVLCGRHSGARGGSVDDETSIDRLGAAQERVDSTMSNLPPSPPPGGFPGGGYPSGNYPGGGYPGGNYPGGDFSPGGFDVSGFGSEVLATWWHRAGASIVDGLLVGVPVLLLVAAAGMSGVSANLPESIISALYAFALIAWWGGQTVGNRAVRTRVVDARTGGPVDPGRSAVRAGVMWILTITFVGGILDIIWPLWDRRKQTLHDKAAGTLVVRR